MNDEMPRFVFLCQNCVGEAPQIKSIDTFDAVSGPISFGGTQAVLRRVLRVLEQIEGDMVYQKVWEY